MNKYYSKALESETKAISLRIPIEIYQELLEIVHHEEIERKSSYSMNKLLMETVKDGLKARRRASNSTKHTIETA